jgi:hypothetical protein
MSRLFSGRSSRSGDRFARSGGQQAFDAPDAEAGQWVQARPRPEADPGGRGSTKNDRGLARPRVQDLQRCI